MIILVINCGSSSIKYQLFKMPDKNPLALGLVEKIGEETSRLNHYVSNLKHVTERPIKNHSDAISLIVKTLTDLQMGVLKDISEIDAIGHRVVHGGESYSDSAIIDDNVINCIREVSDLAPLHNPPNLVGIREAKALLPEVPMVAVFDTAFHQTLPEEAYIYALPYELYTKYRIRRYGFHGSSHAYVAWRASVFLKKPLNELNLITCHLGNGCSLAAIRNGKSVDTTMGLTPLEGLVMGTRCGDIDPAIIFYLLGKDEYGDYRQLDQLLNKKSGLLGISGSSNDLRNLKEGMGDKEKNLRAKLAIKIFSYRLKKYIGAYLAVLGKVHAIIFTGGIGENAFYVREAALANLESCGIELDKKKNCHITQRTEGDLATMSSNIRVLVIPTDEEGWIASETYRLCKHESQ